jgi:equilibrative nucleoside transporter 1/2/3
LQNFYIFYNEKDTEPEKDSEKIKSISKSMDYSESKEIELFGWKRYLHVFRKTWLLLLNIVIIYFVSLSIFPAIQANILPLNHIIGVDYFAPVFCFLEFNVFATVGNYIAQKVRRPGPKYLIIFSVLRLLFIPFFLYCNYHPKDQNAVRTLPVLIKNDWIYIIGGISMALSSGYLSALCMMYAPKCVHPKYAPTAGMMAALVIILGILAGINFSLVYPLIAEL